MPNPDPNNPFTDEEVVAIRDAANEEGGEYTSEQIQGIGAGMSGSAITLLRLLAAWIRTHPG